MGSNYCRTTVLDIIALFSNFFLFQSLYSVVIAVGKEWLQMYCLLHCLKQKGDGKRCLHLFKISAVRVLWFPGNRQEFSEASLHLLSCGLQLCLMSERTEKHVSSLLVLLRILYTLSSKDSYLMQTQNYYIDYL